MEQRIQALEDAVFSNRKTLHNRIKGRFGNQLFQFWVGKWIAMNTNMLMTTYFTQGFYLDISYFPNVGDFIRLNTITPIKRLQSLTPHQRIYNFAFMEDYGTSAVDPDTIIQDIQQDPTPRNVLLSSYNECYKYIRRHSRWIKTLYARASARLGAIQQTVIHLRLGDLVNEFITHADDYLAFSYDIAKQHKLPVTIVSEDSTSSHAQDFSCRLRSMLQPHDIQVILKDTSEESVQEDFDELYRSKVIIMGNSTFSWWAAYLNPFKPNVYVGLSPTRQPHYETRKDLFEEGPRSWKCYNLDNETWLNTRKRKRSAD